MAASALLKFVQGIVVGGDGVALLGVVQQAVSIHNVNNADVASWQIDLVYVDSESALTPAIAYAADDNGNTPLAVFIPDIRGCYRWVLKVWSVINRIGDPDSIDIRNFGVPELNGFITAPTQVFPLPLPDPRTGDVKAKPNELNFDGNTVDSTGWAGDGNTDGLLNRLIRSVDGNRVLPFQVLEASPGPYEICRVDSAKWNPHMFVRAVFDVIVDNDLGANFGYFNRTSIFRLDAGRTLTHLATGEALYANVSPIDGALGLNTAHAIAVTVDAGRYISVIATPAGAPGPMFAPRIPGPAYDLVWKVSAQFFFTQR